MKEQEENSSEEIGILPSTRKGRFADLQDDLVTSSELDRYLNFLLPECKQNGEIVGYRLLADSTFMISYRTIRSAKILARHQRISGNQENRNDSVGYPSIGVDSRKNVCEFWVCYESSSNVIRFGNSISDGLCRTKF